MQCPPAANPPGVGGAVDGAVLFDGSNLPRVCHKLAHLAQRLQLVGSLQAGKGADAGWPARLGQRTVRQAGSTAHAPLPLAARRQRRRGGAAPRLAGPPLLRRLIGAHLGRFGCLGARSLRLQVAHHSHRPAPASPRPPLHRRAGLGRRRPVGNAGRLHVKLPVSRAVTTLPNAAPPCVCLRGGLEAATRCTRSNPNA